MRCGTPAAQRYSIWILRPSIQPSFCRPSRSAATRACPSVSPSERFIRTPRRRSGSAFCADAVHGHPATAPPSSVTKWRRLTSSIGFPSPCRVVPLTQSVCRMLSLPQEGQKVLGLDLNRSESGGAALLCCQSQTIAHHRARRLLHCEIFSRSMTASGRVSRVSPVQTAMRNCTRDEGGPFEVGNQVLISSHRKLLLSKAMVVSVAETPGQDSGRQG